MSPLWFHNYSTLPELAKYIVDFKLLKNLLLSEVRLTSDYLLFVGQ